MVSTTINVLLDAHITLQTRIICAEHYYSDLLSHFGDI